MLEQVSFRNFRCLKEVSIDLGPLTALVGPNASGKSSVLWALRTHSLGASDRWQHRSDLDCTVEYSMDDKRAFSLSLRVPKGQYEVPKGLYQGGFQVALLHLVPEQLRQRIRSRDATTVAPDGSNLANVFNTLTRSEQDQLVGQFCGLIPSLSDVATKVPTEGDLEFRFQDRWNRGAWYEPSEVSDGTLFVLAYLLAARQKPQVDLLAIEEPERGLHPYLLEQLVRLFRMLSKGEVGAKPVQIVLATHSAQLLNFLEPDEVRFLDRATKDGSVQVHRPKTGTEEWRRFYDDYDRALGGMWLAGGLGGVPG